MNYKILFIFLTLFFINSVHALEVSIINDSMVDQPNPNTNYGTGSIGYVGYDSGLEYIYYEIPSTPIQYVVLISNYSSVSAIQMSENININQRPFYNTIDSSLNFYCEAFWDCSLNYVTLYRTSAFDASTITWNNKPELQDAIGSRYMLDDSFNSIVITPEIVISTTQTISPKINTCNNIRSYSDIVIPLFGLALMILGFGSLFITLKSSINGNQISGILITTSIMISIIGFGMILIGNYLLYIIYNFTC